MPSVTALTVMVMVALAVFVSTPRLHVTTPPDSLMVPRLETAET
jgi:hypothetical protein